MTTYKRHGHFYNPVSTVEFLGHQCVVCNVITDLDMPDVRTVSQAGLTTMEEVSAEEWETAVKRAAENIRRGEEMARRRRDANTYGLRVEARSGFRLDVPHEVVIVRVTSTRYIDALDRQWIRTGPESKIGRQVGESKGVFLTTSAIASIEAACKGASGFDFIADGKKSK